MKISSLFCMLVLGLLFSPLSLYAQNRFTHDGKTFIREYEKLFLEESGKKFEVEAKVVTIKFKPGTAEDVKTAFFKNNNIRVVRKNSLGYYDVEIVENADILTAQQNMKRNENIESSEINTLGTYNGTPNDTYYGSQWYLFQASDADIDANEAWNYATGSSSVLVAIIDSNTDWEHGDLGPTGYQDVIQNIYRNTDDGWPVGSDPTSGNGIDDDGNGYIDDYKGWNFAPAQYGNDVRPTNPGYYHGSAVSGVVSAKTNNAIGIAGVAGGWASNGTQLLLCAVGEGGPIGSVLDDAILYAVENGAKIIQMSLSIGQSSAIDYALQTAYQSYGCFIVCASGNGNGSVSYPASNQFVFAVGATDQYDARASFSNFGSNLDVVAPGVDIYTTLPDNNYDYVDGTSFAAPIVSGIAALLISVKSDLTNTQIETIIENSAEDKGTSGFDNYYGYGRVNAARAVRTVVAPTNFHFANSSGNVNIAWDAHPSPILSYYSIERKINAGSWTVIATTTSTSFTDPEVRFSTDPSRPMVYYRINAISTGNISSLYSTVVSTRGNYSPIDTDEQFVEMPSEFRFEQNVPNPFNPSTELHFDLPEQSQVVLRIYNSIGQEVAELINDVRAAGKHSIRWNASALTSGMYFARLDVGNKSYVKKMSLLK